MDLGIVRIPSGDNVTLKRGSGKNIDFFDKGAFVNIYGCLTAPEASGYIEDINQRTVNLGQYLIISRITTLPQPRSSIFLVIAEDIVAKVKSRGDTLLAQSRNVPLKIDRMIPTV